MFIEIFKSSIQDGSTQFLRSLLIFFVLPFRGVSFPYIVHQIAFEPSTCTAKGLSLDTCLIKALLEVIECAMRCEITAQGSFFH